MLWGGMGRAVAGGSLAGSNRGQVGMKRKNVLALPPDVRFDQLEFADDLRAIAREQAIADGLARKRFREQGRIIAEDFERERQQLHAEALQKHTEYLINLKAAELDEKMQAAEQADREESRRVFGAYVERISKAFANAVEEAAKDRERVAERLKKIEKDIERSRLHNKRMKLAERGVIRGRRR
jgi:hypothetical protein